MGDFIPVGHTREMGLTEPFVEATTRLKAAVVGYQNTFRPGANGPGLAAYPPDVEVVLDNANSTMHIATLALGAVIKFIDNDPSRPLPVHLKKTPGAMGELRDEFDSATEAILQQHRKIGLGRPEFDSPMSVASDALIVEALSLTNVAGAMADVGRPDTSLAELRAGVRVLQRTGHDLCRWPVWLVGALQAADRFETVGGENTKDLLYGGALTDQLPRFAGLGQRWRTETTAVDSGLAELDPASTDAVKFIELMLDAGAPDTRPLN